MKTWWEISVCYLGITLHILKYQQAILEGNWRQMALSNVYRLWSVIQPSDDWMSPTATCGAGEKPLDLISAQAGCTCKIWRWCSGDVTSLLSQTAGGDGRGSFIFETSVLTFKISTCENGAVLPLWKQQSTSNTMWCLPENGRLPKLLSSCMHHRKW